MHDGPGTVALPRTLDVRQIREGNRGGGRHQVWQAHSSRIEPGLLRRGTGGGSPSVEEPNWLTSSGRLFNSFERDGWPTHRGGDSPRDRRQNGRRVDRARREDTTTGRARAGPRWRRRSGARRPSSIPRRRQRAASSIVRLQGDGWRARRPRCRSRTSRRRGNEQARTSDSGNTRRPDRISFSASRAMLYFEPVGERRGRLSSVVASPNRAKRRNSA